MSTRFARVVIAQQQFHDDLCEEIPARKVVKLLQREHAMVFAPVKGVGLKRLSDSAIVGTSQGTMRHIHRTARRGVRRLACVQDFAGLSNEERIRHNTAMSVLGVFYEITKAKSVKQIESVVAVTQKVLPLADTLQAFRV